MPKLSLHRRTLYDTVVMSCWCENRADLLRSTALLSVCLLFLSVGVVDPVQTQATLVCFIVWLWGVHRLITWGSLQRTGVTCLPEKEKMFVVRSVEGVMATERHGPQKNVVFVILLSCWWIGLNPQGSGRQSGTESFWTESFIHEFLPGIFWKKIVERMNRESFWDKKRIAPSLSDTQNDVFNWLCVFI